MLNIVADGLSVRAKVNHQIVADDPCGSNGRVMNSWRYLPASVNGKPIETWTTVIVRFAAI